MTLSGAYLDRCGTSVRAYARTGARLGATGDRAVNPPHHAENVTTLTAPAFMQEQSTMSRKTNQQPLDAAQMTSLIDTADRLTARYNAGEGKDNGPLVTQAQKAQRVVCRARAGSMEALQHQIAYIARKCRETDDEFGMWMGGTGKIVGRIGRTLDALTAKPAADFDAELLALAADIKADIALYDNEATSDEARSTIYAAQTEKEARLSKMVPQTIEGALAMLEALGQMELDATGGDEPFTHDDANTAYENIVAGLRQMSGKAVR
jgi:hypothetical protein